jgi:hypothetical protein
MPNFMTSSGLPIKKKTEFSETLGYFVLAQRE